MISSKNSLPLANPEPIKLEGSKRKQILQIDPRSFHVFTYGDDRIFFDRRTGSTIVVSEEVFHFFDGIEQGLTYEEIAISFSNRYGIETAQSLLVELEMVVAAMRREGMLVYAPVDRVAQDRELEALWNHRPRRIQLLMAQGCNLGCRYCYAWRNGSNQKETLMDWTTAKRSVDFLVERSGPRRNLQVTFFGGEPLLNKDVVINVVDYCRELERSGPKKFVFEIITNATLLTVDLVDYFVREKFMMMISMDGWKEMHNYNRPSMEGVDHYEHILSIAKYANSAFISAGLGPVKIRANLTSKYADIEGVEKYLYDQGFSKIGLSVIEPLPSGIRSPGAVTDEQLDSMRNDRADRLERILQQVERGERLSYADRVIVSKSVEPPLPRSVRGLTCGAGRNTAIVDNKGNVYPCHRYEGMDKFVIGNVFSGMSRELTMAYYRKMNRNAMARCHSCWIRDYCSGGCAWLLAKEDGEIADPTPEECDRRREGMEMALSFRYRLRAIRPEIFTRETGNIELDSVKGICSSSAKSGSEECGNCSGCD